MVEGAGGVGVGAGVGVSAADIAASLVVDGVEDEDEALEEVDRFRRVWVGVATPSAGDTALEVAVGGVEVELLLAEEDLDEKFGRPRKSTMVIATLFGG